jgi:hypothetical protein
MNALERYQYSAHPPHTPETPPDQPSQSSTLMSLMMSVEKHKSEGAAASSHEYLKYSLP